MEDVIDALVNGNYDTATYILDRAGAPMVFHAEIPRKRWAVEEDEAYDLFERNLSKSIASKGIINFHVAPEVDESTTTFIYNGYTFKITGKS